jgi:predicted metal-binding transcription factor (methanogenesis marker protein 9)
MAKAVKTKPNPAQDKKLRREFLKKAEETLLDVKKQLMREIQDRVKTETEGSKD